MTTHYEIIKKCILFSGVSDETMEKIALLTGQKTVRFLPGEEVVYNSGNERNIGILLSGKVRIEKDSADSHTLLMRYLAPSQVFGVAALFGPAEPMSRLFAEKKTEIQLFSKEAVLGMFQLDSRISENYIAYLSDRIAFLNKKIEGLSGYNAESK